MIRRLTFVGIATVLAWIFWKWGSHDGVVLARAWSGGMVETIHQFKPFVTAVLFFAVMVVCLSATTHDILTGAASWEAEVRACSTSALLFYGIGFVLAPSNLLGNSWAGSLPPFTSSALACLPVVLLFVRRARSVESASREMA